MSDFDRRRDIEAEGQRALMVPSKPDLSNVGKSTAYKIGYRQGQADALSAAMELPEVKALLGALRDMRRQFSPYPSEDTERWREEHEACERADAALAAIKEQKT